MSDYIKPIIIIGDIHGKWDRLKQEIKRFAIADGYLICVGDLGIGFSSYVNKEHRVHASMNEFFARRNIHFMSIRGNHDDPKYFTRDYGWTWSHFELIPDYTTKIINGHKWQFVGGGLSVDRTGNHRKLNSTYWADEAFVLRPELVEKCDFLVTHSAPSWSGPSDKGPVIRSWEKNDPLIWGECVEERRLHDRLYELSQPRMHYAGHFHEYHFTRMAGSVSIILNELQMKEHWDHTTD